MNKELQIIFGNKFRKKQHTKPMSILQKVKIKEAQCTATCTND